MIYKLSMAMRLFRGVFAFSSVVEVLVIGGGHAGCEAAHIAARSGASTCLVTQSRQTIG